MGWCVCIVCVGNGKMEESSKCGRKIIICINYFALFVYVSTKTCAIMQCRTKYSVIDVFVMTMCVFFCFSFLCWYCRCE